MSVPPPPEPDPPSDSHLVLTGPFLPESGPPPTIPDVTITGEIGRGGMGVVYRGRQTYIDREVAVKVLASDPGSASGKHLVRRFQREATILAQLSHPHIVTCYSAGMLTDRVCYLVMEFIDGPNLAQHVAAHGAMAEADAVRVARDIAAALAYAQGRGITHRDVKPENVLLHPDPAGGSFPWTAKLVDLGLARPVHLPSDLTATQPGALMGSPTTMAPEQFEDPEGTDFRIDIYGLGCVLFQILAGKPAFTATSLASLVGAKMNGPEPDIAAARPGVSPGMAALVTSMLARNPQQRPPSYAAIIARCEALLAGERAAPRRRWPMPVMVGGAIALVLALVGIGRAGGGLEPAPAAAPAPLAADAAPSAPPVEPSAEPPLSAPRPLVGRDLRSALADWITVPGWGLAEEGDHLIGHSSGTSRITHPLPGAPWAVAGRMRPGQRGANAFREAGVRIELADGAALQIAVKGLGAACLLALTEVGPDGVPKPPLQLLPLPVAEDWPLRVACQRGQLRVEIGGVTLNPVPVRQATTGLGLFVQQGAVAFAELTLATP